ncbi:hypothetical protein JXJ21_22990 [candidate division KSB1 bacterium]|nr:hypothetical protein [candidate division KSB1 bacterium]
MEQKLFRWLNQNFRIKAIVLVLAILLWFYVITEKTYNYTIEVPIQPINVRTGKVIINDYAKSASVTLKGSGRHLLSLLLESDIEILINLQGTTNRLKESIKKESVAIPRLSQVSILSINSPDSVTFVLGNLIRKHVPVRHNIIVKPLQGYTQVGRIILEPDSIWITGAETEVANIDFISTKKFELKKTRKKVSEIIDLAVPRHKNVTLKQNYIRFYVDIQKLLEKRITGVPVQVRNAPANMNVIVIPSHLSLTLEGGVDVLANVTEKDINAYIDYKRKRNSSETGHPAYIETPPGIRTRDVAPQKFKLILERE